MNHTFKTIFILLSIIINSNFVFGQDQSFSKNSIKTGIGFGASMSKRIDGFGFVYSIGYQRDIWKDRLRFNPNYSIGHYSSRFTLDARDQYFNSINIEAKFYYDIIKIKSFSLVLGAGGLGHN